MLHDYVTRCIERELKNFDLPKKLTFVKHNLKNSIVPDDLFSRQAFENLKKEFEEKIEQEKIEVQNRQILGDSLDDSDKKEILKKHKELTLDRAVLTISYLLDELDVKCPLSKKKEFIAFITPYSPNTIKEKLENLHEKADIKPDKYEEDLQIIIKYFENLGLTKIVDQIKRDLEIG